jgi:hypothetical protein
MDQRQTQIRERAGLEESLLNQDFIEWLRKWGTPLLMAAAVLAVGYTLYLRYQKGQSARVDEAFAALEHARSGANASPDSLLGVAAEYDGVRAVGMLARLTAADAYLDAVRRRMKIGAELELDAATRQPTGRLVNPEDALTPEDKAAYLERAEGLYLEVHDAAARDSGNILTRVNAMFGLAAVSEARGEWESAGEWYGKIAVLVEGTSYVALSEIAKARQEAVGTLGNQPPVPLADQVPKMPPPPEALPNPGDALNPPEPKAPPEGEPVATPPAEAPKPAEEPKPAEPAPAEPAPK